MNKIYSVNELTTEVFFSLLVERHREEALETSLLFVEKLNEILTDLVLENVGKGLEFELNLSEDFFVYWLKHELHCDLESFVMEHFRENVHLSYEIDFIKRSASVFFEFSDELAMKRIFLMAIPLTKGRAEFLFSTYSCALIALGAEAILYGSGKASAQGFLFADHMIEQVIDMLFA